MASVITNVNLLKPGMSFVMYDENNQIGLRNLGKLNCKVRRTSGNRVYFTVTDTDPVYHGSNGWCHTEQVFSAPELWAQKGD